jgi:hypothetical protein
MNKFKAHLLTATCAVELDTMWKWAFNSTNLTDRQLEKRSSSLGKNQCVWEASQAYTVISSTDIAMLAYPPYFTGQLI